jgi:hypothetical protein
MAARPPASGWCQIHTCELCIRPLAPPQQPTGPRATPWIRPEFGSAVRTSTSRFGYIGRRSEMQPCTLASSDAAGLSGEGP